MRIQTLTLKNFRSHHETVLDLDRFNFARGPNGCGKTSIQMALEFLFTGRCEMTDAAGRGAESLIRSGAKELEVSATLEGGETICRRRTPRSHIVELNGNRVPVDAAEAALEKRFGSADVLSAVLNAGRFIAMSVAEQKRLLVQVVDAGKLEVPGEILEAMRAINEEPPKLKSVSDVETAYRRFYDLRTEAGRTLKALGQMENPDVAPDLPDVQEVRKKLEDLRQQKERLIAQKAADAAAWDSAQARLRRVQAEVEEASAEILSPGKEQELLQLASQQDRAEKLRQELTDLVANQKAAEKCLAAVLGLKGRCPQCRQPISEEVKTREMAALRERVADLDGMIQGTKEELSEYGDMATAIFRLEEHRKALARRAKLTEEESKLQAMQRPNAGDLDGRMTILVERINKGERVLERAQQLQRGKAQWEAYVREKASLEARIDSLGRLTEFFGPNGALMSRAGSRMQSFAEGLNRQLAAFGYTCNLALDPFDISVVSKDSHCSLSLSQLSESEQFRFGVAFQISMAQATGSRFVVIDRADVLDKERRRMLASLLVNSGLDQAIVLATSEEPAPENVPGGVRFFDLTEVSKWGRVSPLMAEAVCLSTVQGLEPN
jgi:RecF/RecN/SMC N terminal domain